MKINSWIVTSALFVFLFVTMRLPAKNQEPAWLDANVLAQGHTQSQDVSGKPLQLATLTVEVLDAGNSDPRQRRTVWIVSADALFSKTNIETGVGAKWKVYYVAHEYNGYDALMVQYFDKKGKEKQEIHLVIREL